jgi:hypothetical protein
VGKPIELHYPCPGVHTDAGKALRAVDLGVNLPYGPGQAAIGPASAFADIVSLDGANLVQSNEEICAQHTPASAEDGAGAES